MKASSSDGVMVCSSCTAMPRARARSPISLAGRPSTAPGLADLPALIECTRTPGLRVELEEAGQPAEVPEGVAVAAFRIVQEALANVVRHARAGRASLLIGNEPGMIVVGEAATGAAAVSLTKSARPDVVLMDIRMPELDGIEATRRIAADPESAASKVLILTTFDLDEYVFGAIRAGASGFLVKDTPPAQLLAAIRVIAAGEALLTPSATRRMISEFTRHPAPQQRPSRSLDHLTSREREVLQLIGQGLSNSEICQRLHISVATAKTHIGRLLAKLDARDRAQLVIAAY